jgi:hypothetical protein
MFLYSVNVTPSDYASIQAKVDGQNGTGLTYDIYSAHAEFMPMVLFATTPYNAGRPATKNYMYQMFNGEQPSVTTDTLSKSLDALKINYLGQTAQAGSTDQRETACLNPATKGHMKKGAAQPPK